MDAPDLLNLLVDLGFRIWVESDRLMIAPRDRLTDELRSLIRAHRGEILAALGAPAMIPPDRAEALREAYEERAAIMEYDGSLTRGDAERGAWALVSKRHRLH
ncbi:MAG TPA: hypothetical protein VNM24_12260 [Burkholderiales bacterium]|nr:hypothetical protein [Burkholderiales bacterium]